MKRANKTKKTEQLLTGHLNHTTSQLQQLADRAERLNEWIDMDTIVLQRLKTAAEATPVSPTSISSNIPHLAPAIAVDPAVTAQIIELQERIAVAKGWLKELERSVYWQREEYRRTEKAMGRKKSGQSGSFGSGNIQKGSVGGSNTKKGVTYGSDIGGGEGEAATAEGGGSAFSGPSGVGGPSGLGGLGGLGAPGVFGGACAFGGPSWLGGGQSGLGAASGLGGGQSGLGGSGLFDGLDLSADANEDALHALLAQMNANIMEEQAGGQEQGQGHGDVLRPKDYARERWSSGKQSRLPTQEEWEEMFGKGVSSFVTFALVIADSEMRIRPSGSRDGGARGGKTWLGWWKGRRSCSSRVRLSFVGRLFVGSFQRYVFHLDCYPIADKLTQILSRTNDFFEGLRPWR